MQKEIEYLEFVQSVNFEIIDSLKNNVTKYLLSFDHSCDKICNSKAFVDLATAGRHRRLSTFYIKHNLFHRSKHGRDVELQNTHIVFSSLHVIWCKSVRLVHNWDSDHNYLTGIETQHLFPTIIYWLTCRHAQTIEYVIVQTPDTFAQNFISRTGWNGQKI